MTYIENYAEMTRCRWDGISSFRL